MIRSLLIRSLACAAALTLAAQVAASTRPALDVTPRPVAPLQATAPASLPVQPPPPALSFVTFNLQHDRELWRARRELIVRELGYLRPDVIALQEVIEHPAQPNQAQWLAEALGYDYEFVSSDPPGAAKRYGNALLTRRPVLARHQRMLLPLDDYRTSAHLRIDLDGTPVNVYVTHLNERADLHGTRTRTTQIADLMDFVQETSDGAPVAIAGDFNTVADSVDLAALRSHYDDSYAHVHAKDPTPVSTLNVRFHGKPMRIDHIFFDPRRFVARDAQILFERPDRQGLWASDHYGVWTRLELAVDHADPSAMLHP